MPFICTICEEESTRICVACTKDTCGNHLCEKCGRCSDCCDCELRLDETEPVKRIEVTDALADAPPPEPQPHPHPMPDPDPAPEPDPMPIPGFPGPEQIN